MSSRSGQSVVWITGAGKGIGRALALRMAKGGWIVAASARTEDDLLSLSASCPAGQIHPFTLDVTDASQNEQVIADIESQVGSIDLAVLNAGTYKPGLAAELSIDDFRSLFETNLMGTAHGLIPMMQRFTERRAGHIAVVASLAGYRGLPTSAAYGATKAGLINMCEALKPELDNYGVRLSLINPGFVKTPLTDMNSFPMPFLVSADEAADAIVRGLAGGAFEIAFPKPFAWIMKTLRILPHRLFFSVTRRMMTR